MKFYEERRSVSESFFLKTLTPTPLKPQRPVRITVKNIV